MITGIGVGVVCVGGEEFNLFFLAVMIVLTHYLLVLLWAGEGLICFCFVCVLEICLFLILGLLGSCAPIPGRSV